MNDTTIRVSEATILRRQPLSCLRRPSHLTALFEELLERTSTPHDPLTALTHDDKEIVALIHQHLGTDTLIYCYDHARFEYVYRFVKRATASTEALKEL